MDTKNNSSREIDVKNVLWNLLLQWKPVVLFALICSFVAVIYLLCTPVDTSKTQSIDSLKSALTYDEISRVENAVLLQKFQRTLNDFSTGYNINYATVQCSISANAATNMSNLVSAYYNTLIKEDSNSLSQKLKNIDKRYIDLSPEIDIIYVDNPSSYSDITPIAFFAVKVMIAKDMDSNEINKTIISALKDAHDLLSDIYPHDITIVSSMITSSAEMMFTRINTLHSNAFSNNNYFSEQQNLLYTAMMIQEGLLNPPSSLNSSSTSLTRFFKYSIVGFIMGIFIYSLIFTLVYILDGKIRSLDEVVSCYSIRAIDDVHNREFSSAMEKFLYSKKIYTLRYAAQHQQMDEHSRMAARYVHRLTKHENLNRVSLIYAYKEQTTCKVLKDYIDWFKEEWSKNTSLQLDTKNSYIDDYSTVISDNDGIIIIINPLYSKYKNIEEIISICHSNNIIVLGIILLEA